MATSSLRSNGTRSRVGLPPRGSYLCFGGALAAAYGVEEAVRALDVVLHARPEYGAVLLVGSFVKDEPSVAAVRRLIAAHGSERVSVRRRAREVRT